MKNKFVFPMYRDMAYYTISIDARNGTAYIIDSMNEDKQDCTAQKYGWIISEVRNNLGEYFKMKRQFYRSTLVKKANLVVMHVKWGDRGNAVDTGVYTMRHMETYMGEAPTSWTSGLFGKSARQLRILRVRYCAALLMWDLNEVKHESTSRAVCYHKELLGNTRINITHSLLG